MNKVLPSPIVLNTLDAERSLYLLRTIAEQPIPGECGFERYYATDAARFIANVREALAGLGQQYRQPRPFRER